MGRVDTFERYADLRGRVTTQPADEALRAEAARVAEDLSLAIEAPLISRFVAKAGTS